jgi:hypothetical protein
MRTIMWVKFEIDISELLIEDKLLFCFVVVVVVVVYVYVYLKFEALLK